MVAAIRSFSSVLVAASLILTLGIGDDVSAFVAAPQTRAYYQLTKYHPSLSTTTHLCAKKKATNTSSAGGGFGGNIKSTGAAKTTVAADKYALETQWDTFASITNLDIVPNGNPDDEDYIHFIVADVFVRVGPCSYDGEDVGIGGTSPSTTGGGGNTGWYRTGKVVSSGETTIQESLAMQRALILWTAVHMWPQLAAKGNEGAKRLEVGFHRPTLTMAEATDTALEADEAEEIIVPERVSVRDISIKSIGFRPDFNPPGFTYKRRERAAMKKKKSALEEIEEAG